MTISEDDFTRQRKNDNDSTKARQLVQFGIFRLEEIRYVQQLFRVCYARSYMPYVLASSMIIR